MIGNLWQKKLPKWLKICISLGAVGFFAGVLLVFGVIYHFSRQLPDFRTLGDYRPSLITKIYAHDAQILAEYARERRIYTSIEDIPQELIQAFLAAEDTNFYHHWGFDPKGILRAALVNIFTSRIQGASTITQQVAKTFLLSSERTYKRKIKELILSWRIENVFSKDEILELYLNQIYLGAGAYGVAAAAQTYFGKPLSELALGERALIAGLPKAPSKYSPVRHPQRAKARRDIVLRRMEAENFITPQTADEEVSKPLILGATALKRSVIAPHFSEMVRREILQMFDEDTLYHGGLKIYTTLDLNMQKTAESVLYEGLRKYDRRHGWRGALTTLNLLVNWQEKLGEEATKNIHSLQVGNLAVVLAVNDKLAIAEIGLIDGSKGQIPLKQVTWARRYIDANGRGPRIKKVSDVLSKGNIVFVRQLENKTYSLEQKPLVQGALVVIDNKTGAVRAMVGGLGDGSGFNRAVQGKRQAGSVFKPFVYTAAMEAGLTPASIILDAPVIFRSGDESWKPSNYTARIHGASTLRRGLEESRNLMTIRLAKEVGLTPIIKMSQRFGMDSDLAYGDLTVALGSGSFTLFDMVSAYTVFPNGGKKANSYFISRVQDASGNTVFRQHGWCDACVAGTTFEDSAVPIYEIASRTVINPQVAFQITSMLQGVIERGTARSERRIRRPAGGKTGTTNEYKDAWFVGFTPSISAGVWVGFDNPATLGKREAGGKVAAPIWGDFMLKAFKNEPAEVFNVPQGINFVRIDANTGKLPNLTTKKTLLEAFIAGTEPKLDDVQSQPELPESGTVTPFGLF